MQKRAIRRDSRTGRIARSDIKSVVKAVNVLHLVMDGRLRRLAKKGFLRLLRQSGTLLTTLKP